MKRHFYSHLVEIDSVVGALDLLELSPEEKKHLADLAHEHLHQVIVDAILSELSERDKKIFLANLQYEDDEKIWKHLNDKVVKIEEKIMRAAEDIKYELHKDIKETAKG